MTTRAGGIVLDSLRLNRTKRICRLAFIQRQDGEVLRLTDHDRPVTLDVPNGGTFYPLNLASISADRREAAFRSGNQEAVGIIDGQRIVLADVRANRFRGARVRIVETDWQFPWHFHAAHQRYIREIRQDGSTFVAVLEGVTQRLERPSSDHHGGTFAPKCQQQLGGPGCLRDIRLGTGFAAAGGKVDAIITARQVYEMDPATVYGTTEDDFYRDGSIEWLWAEAVETGTTTAVLTAGAALTAVLTDSTATWVVDEHVGRWARILAGVGIYPHAVVWGLIYANTATTLSFRFTHSPQDGTNAATYPIGSDYDICPSAANYGTTSPVHRYTHSSRRIELLFPTPKPISIGDSGVLRAGCDGLISTCGGKFGDAEHPLNHGGDPFQPSAQQVLEPPEAQ